MPRGLVTNLEYERRARGLTQTKLAAVLDLHQGDISAAENLRKVRPQVLTRLSQFFGMPPAVLLAPIGPAGQK